MDKAKIFFVSLFLFIGIFTSKAQFSVGIENTRLVYGQFTLKKHYFTKINVSVYSENISSQYARLSLGYLNEFKMFKFNGQFQYGSTFNGSYYTLGAHLEVDALFVKRLLLNGILKPWYDSGFGYKTCFQITAGSVITNNINIFAGYTTIPEYRMSESRVLAGLDFHVNKLQVIPAISFGTNKTNGGRRPHINFAFNYQF